MTLSNRYDGVFIFARKHRIWWDMNRRSMVLNTPQYIKAFDKVVTQLLFTCSKAGYRNTTKRCEICSKLTIKNPEQRQWRHSGVIVNFEHILHLFLPFLLLALNKLMVAGGKLKVFYLEIFQFPANIYLFKVSKRKSFEIYSKLTIKTLEWCHWRCSSVFIAGFEHISHLLQMVLFLIFDRWIFVVLWSGMSSRLTLHWRITFF